MEDLGTTGEGRQGGVEDWGGETGLNWATARLKGDRERFVGGDMVGIGRAGDIKSFRCMGRVGICRGGGGGGGLQPARMAKGLNQRGTTIRRKQHN